MRIGIDAYSVKNLTGIGRYTREMIRALAEHAGKDVEVVLFHPEGPPWQDFDVGPIHRVNVPARSRLAWEAYALRGSLAKNSVDVFHGPDFTLPATEVPAALTVHDVAFLDRPEFVSWRARLLYGALTPSAVRRARIVLCPTEHARSRTAERLGVAPGKIHVVPEGVARCFLTDDDPREVCRLDGPLNNRPFVLTVGAVQARKNLIATAIAVSSLRDAGENLALAVAGADGVGASAIRERIVQALGRSNVWFGRPSDRVLAALYRAARVVCVTSHYEGFGLPVLEALASGAPVVISDVPALVEVAGGAAVVAGRTAETIAEAIATILRESPTERDARRKGGMDRAASFSWAKTARSLLRVYREVAGHRA